MPPQLEPTPRDPSEPLPDPPPPPLPPQTPQVDAITMRITARIVEIEHERHILQAALAGMKANPALAERLLLVYGVMKGRL